MARGGRGLRYAVGDGAPGPAPCSARRLQDDAAVLAKTREVVAGATPVAALPPSVIAALADVEPDLDALLAATRTERADLPDSLDAVGTGGWAATWQIAATLAGARMRMVLAAGEPRRALRDGLDALALGRDVAIARGLIGRMVGAAIVSRLAPPVSAAVDALRDPADRRDALRRLRVIRDALPPFSRTLGDEMIYTQLYMGEALSTRVRSALDPRAGAMVREGLRDTTWWTRLMVRDGWRDLRKAQDAVVAAADLPEEERTAAWKDVEARLMRLANPYAAIGLPDYGRYARRAEASVRRLDALVLAAAAGAFRDSLGRWPRSVAEIASFGAIDAEEAARLAEAELRVGPDGGGHSLIVPLPRADEKEPGDIRLVLRGSAAGD